MSRTWQNKLSEQKGELPPAQPFPTGEMKVLKKFETPKRRARSTRNRKSYSVATDDSFYSNIHRRVTETFQKDQSTSTPSYLSKNRQQSPSPCRNKSLPTGQMRREIKIRQTSVPSSYPITMTRPQQSYDQNEDFSGDSLPTGSRARSRETQFNSGNTNSRTPDRLKKLSRSCPKSARRSARPVSADEYNQCQPHAPRRDVGFVLPPGC